MNWDEEIAQVRKTLDEAGYQGHALIPIPNGRIEYYRGVGTVELIAVEIFTTADGCLESFQLWLPIDGLEALRFATARRVASEGGLTFTQLPTFVDLVIDFVDRQLRRGKEMYELAD